MTVDGGVGHLWIVGTGRLGPAFGAEIVRAEGASGLTFVGRSSAAPEFRDPLLADAGYFSLGDAARAASPDTVLIAVPDDAIRTVADELAAMAIQPAVVLHTSGALAAAAELAPLRAAGWQTGSIHPLVAIPDAFESAGKLRGAWFGVEGDEEASRRAERIVALLGGRMLSIDPDWKPLYHAAAVMTSNYVVALLDVAVGMLNRSGVDRRDAEEALGRLAAGAATDAAGAGTRQALTGPFVRGDLGTLRLHLDQLSEVEAQLYSVLAREALRIAVDRGLQADAVAGVEDILREAAG